MLALKGSYPDVTTNKMKTNKDTAQKPSSTAHQAKDIIGKIALIGLTYYQEGQPPELKQLYGRVTKVNKQGISLELEGSHKGELFNLPPGIKAFEFAMPGYYRFRSSDEGVENPDFIVTYTIYPDKDTFKNSTANKKVK
jgi:hypothetical protein